MTTIRDTKWSFPKRITVRICPPNYQTQSVTLKKAIFWNLVVRATISHTPLDFQNHHATTRVTTCYPNTSYTRNWVPNKASHQDIHPTLCRIPRVIHRCVEWTFDMKMDIDTMTNNSQCFLALTFYFIRNCSYYICHEWTFGMEMDNDAYTK